MIAVIVVMGRLPVVMRRRLMLRSGIVMVLGGRMLLFLGHGNFLLETTSVPDVSGQRARSYSVTNFTTGASAGKRQRRPGLPPSTLPLRQADHVAGVAASGFHKVNKTATPRPLIG
jgi:hypothetical protein